MSLVDALILGLVQGLSEFLPVSSSAHLVIFQHLLGMRESMLFFDIVVHVGTLISIFVYFARDVAQLIRDSICGVFFLIRRRTLQQISEAAPSSYRALGILIASIPTGLMGFLFKEQFEAMFGSLKAVGVALLGTSLILWLTRRVRRGHKTIEQCRALDFLLIGTFQGIAIIPGISRSGATIAAGLFRGIKSDDAFRFSFLLAIPAILGAALLELQKGFLLPQEEWVAYTVGFITAAVSGYAAIAYLSSVMKKGKLHRFALYTLILSLAVLTLAHKID